MTDAAPRIMLFDLYASGHHLQYLTQLIEYWIQSEYGGRIEIVVPRSFVTAHPDFPDCNYSRASRSELALTVIEESIDFESRPRAGPIARDREHGRLLKKYINRCRPDHCVLMAFDEIQLSLAFGLRFNFPVLISGIYFRSFNRTGLGINGFIKRIRKRALLNLAVKNSHFKWLFCLDRQIVPKIQTSSATAVYLPDGIQSMLQGRTRTEIRKDWAVEDGRVVVLFFGGISERKGIFKVMEAASLLTDPIRKRMALVLQGAITELERSEIEYKIEHVRTLPGVQLVVRDEFVSESDVQNVINSADLNLIVYQQHEGSSGVLIRSAAAPIPVLGSDYGMVGENIRVHYLGQAIDSTSARAIADGLVQFLTNPETYRFNAEKARAFAAENTAEAFSETIFDRISSFPGDSPD